MRKRLQPFVILLAEDEPADARLVIFALDQNRVEADVRHLVDGREALAYLRREGERFATAVRPDLILLDLNMPGMDGREFLVAIKQDPALCAIPVVVVSTSEVDRDVRDIYRLGASGYLAKPLDVDEFISGIRLLTDYWMSLVKLPERQ
ncbi:MAG TPA: response regulator [Candidatus Accumulibacter sp.]|uniref:response regulator n=1 Tax=Accumulibacter sp. TaxID=2053492 RepID=UPI000EBA61D3|nr:response regulator [Accumulibacter sp.]HCZ13112.1 response regulator [Accumulibacter sp.]